MDLLFMRQVIKEKANFRIPMTLTLRCCLRGMLISSRSYEYDEIYSGMGHSSSTCLSGLSMMNTLNNASETVFHFQIREVDPTETMKGCIVLTIKYLHYMNFLVIQNKMFNKQSNI